MHILQFNWMKLPNMFLKFFICLYSMLYIRASFICSVCLIKVARCLHVALFTYQKYYSNPCRHAIPKAILLHVIGKKGYVRLDNSILQVRFLTAYIKARILLKSFITKSQISV